MENRFNIGEMDTLVSLQSCEIGRGDKGQKTYSFTEHGKVWAKIERNINESVSNYNLEQGESLLATVYKVKGMTTRWRVVIAGIPYSIISIDPISRFSPLCTLSLNSAD